MSDSNGIGRSPPRVEDQRFVTGTGQFTDDRSTFDMVHAVFVRSDFALAKILSVQTEDAENTPDVIAVLTCKELEQDGVGHLPYMEDITDGCEPLPTVPPNPLLANKRTVYVGEPIAMVVAKTHNAARDAAELVEIDYDPLNPVERTELALDPSSEQIWPQAPGNLALDWECGDGVATTAAFERAAHVVSLTVKNNRIAINPLEPRSAIANYDETTDCLTLTTPTQAVHAVHTQIAERVLNLPADKIRIITPDVGGAFGGRFYCGREQILTMWAARRLNQTVTWTADRNESFFCDGQARDHISSGELALDNEGRFVGYSVSNIANMGSHINGWGVRIPTIIGNEVLTGLYDIPVAHVRVRCVLTNMVPVETYRGTGRAEVIYLLERLVDAAARKLKLQPDEIRRRNYIRPDQLPYRTVLGQTYDSGDFAAAQQSAMIAADWNGIDKRKQMATNRGKLRGIGMCSYVMSAAGLFDEQARIALRQDGSLSVLLGTQSTGQGHETVYTQLIVEHFGVDPQDVSISQGDSQDCPTGAGTAQSRSLIMGGHAIDGAAKGLTEILRKVAGRLLQVSPGDLKLADGLFVDPKARQRISLSQIAEAVAPDEEYLEYTFTAPETAMTFPHGCHICEVDIDPSTGGIEILSYVSVDDFGKVFNHSLCEGQVHGAVVQGIGQALLEEVVYEKETGQLLSGSLMDYCLARADDIPFFNVNLVEDAPCLTNSMGAKGAGEAGSIAAPPAVMNALHDALSPLGINHLDMPATPLKVWQAIQDSN